MKKEIINRDFPVWLKTRNCPVSIIEKIDPDLYGKPVSSKLILISGAKKKVFDHIAEFVSRIGPYCKDAFFGNVASILGKENITDEWRDQPLTQTFGTVDLVVIYGGSGYTKYSAPDIGKYFIKRAIKQLPMILNISLKNLDLFLPEVSSLYEGLVENVVVT